MKRIDQCIHANLANICHQAMQLDRLQLLVNQFLPIQYQEYCQVTSFYKGCLTLSAKDAVWASQLRFLQPELRNHLRTQGKLYQLTNIKIKIFAEEQVNDKPGKKPPELSKTARDLLRQEASNCQHPPLQLALEKLASQYGSK